MRAKYDWAMGTHGKVIHGRVLPEVDPLGLLHSRKYAGIPAVNQALGLKALGCRITAPTPTATTAKKNNKKQKSKKRSREGPTKKSPESPGSAPKNHAG